jgi:hypothetical protein
MKTQHFFIDLTQRPPRSFRVRLGTYVFLARMLAKGRATLAGKYGEYIYNSPTDAETLASFARKSGPAFQNPGRRQNLSNSANSMTMSALEEKHNLTIMYYE